MLYGLFRKYEHRREEPVAIHGLFRAKWFIWVHTNDGGMEPLYSGKHLQFYLRHLAPGQPLHHDYRLFYDAGGPRGVPLDYDSDKLTPDDFALSDVPRRISQRLAEAVDKMWRKYHAPTPRHPGRRASWNSA